MKLTLITHHRPHIDDICGVWLLLRFWRPAKDADISFISALERDPGDPERIWVGVGRGRFDEHKGDIGESAASLVFKFIEQERPDLDALTNDALTRLVTWVRDEDMGLHDTGTDREFTPAPILRTHFDRGHRDSSELLRFGMVLLDDIFEALMNYGRLRKDWERREEFQSQWGRAVALATAAHSADGHAYSQGFVLFVFLDPKTGYRGFRGAPDSKVDLTEAYETLRRADSKAGWYLHHSRKLLLCGSDVAPGTKLSKLGLRDMIRVLQNIEDKVVGE